MIYLDNAATTFPKPEEVYEALDYANRNMAFNAGRGEYQQSTEAFNLIQDTREKLASFVNRDANEVVFTSSATESLNLIINGITIESGDHVYVSPFEHNAVMRPLKLLQEKVNFELKVLPFDKVTWEPDLDSIKNEFALYHPKAIFISHISNVTGYVVPYKEIFEYGMQWNSINVLDCSQSFGVKNPDNLDLVNYLVFAGHKSLYASFGIAGFFKLKDDDLKVVKAGGTGSDSLNLDMPVEKPYRYESGSPNIVAIYGLNKSIDWLKNNDVEGKEEELLQYLYEKIKDIDGIEIYKPERKLPFGILSINLEGYKSDELAEVLNEDYDICVRSGYHCAPLVHDFLGSKKYNGTVRVSISSFTSKEEINNLILALEEIGQ